MFGAIVGRHSLKRNSANPDAFDVKIISQEDCPVFREFEGRKFLRGGNWRVWESADLQSFTPVRLPRWSRPLSASGAGQGTDLTERGVLNRLRSSYTLGEQKCVELRC